MHPFSSSSVSSSTVSEVAITEAALPDTHLDIGTEVSGQVQAGGIELKAPATGKAPTKSKTTGNTKGKTKGKAKGRARARPYKEGKTWSMRLHYEGHDIYCSGHETEKAADKAVRDRQKLIDINNRPAGLGAGRTTLAQALQDYAMEKLPFLKGAVQEARRINWYLRYAGLETLVITKLADKVAEPSAKTGKSVYFEVELEPHTLERRIANGLHRHRKAQLTQNARTEKYRAVLATTAMDKVTPNLVQGLINAMRLDNNAPATIELERSMLRVLFYHAKSGWSWKDLGDNPACKLTMPSVDNKSTRVMSQAEQTLLDASFAECRNDLVAPVVTLLRETAMRASEPLQNAYWRDVNWERKIIKLGDSKNGTRDVPLSPVALEALEKLGPGEPDERIVKITYEALRASWQRVCERAGIKGLSLKAMRTTAATRMALKSGNAFLVQALTGHKTWSMVMRYVNVTADDVVNIMHTPEPTPEPTKAAVSEPAPVVAQPSAALATAVNDTQRATQSAARPEAKPTAQHGVTALVASSDAPPVMPAVAEQMFTFEQMQAMAVHAANAAVNAAVSRLANVKSVHAVHAADALAPTGQSVCAADEQDAMSHPSENVVPLKRAVG